MKVKTWFWSLGSFFYAIQAVACFHYRYAYVNLPGKAFMNSFYGAVALGFCGLYFTVAFQHYRALTQSRLIPSLAPARIRRTN
jgi:hypothetical protein